VTLGCVARATPPVDPLGCCVNASCAAGPTATTNEELTAEVRAPSVAVSVYVLARSTLQPTKLAMPATAATGLAVQLNVPPAGVVNTSVTELVSVVTVLPARSCTATRGCVARATPPVEALGCCVNASCAAGPAVTENASRFELEGPPVSVALA